MKRSVPVAVCALAVAAAGPVRADAPAARICLASPARASAWLRAAVDSARRTGVGGAAATALSNWMTETLGADLIEAQGCRSVGLDADHPVCVVGPVSPHARIVVTARIADSKKTLRMLERLAASRDAGARTARSWSPKNAKGWFFAAKAGGDVLAFALRDGVGFFGATREDVANALQDHREGAQVSFPDGEVAVAARVDLRALGTAVGSDALVRAADTLTPEILASFAIRAHEMHVELQGASTGLLAVAGAAIDQAARATGRAVLERIADSASGFLQVRLPIPAVLSLWQKQGPDASTAWSRDLLAALSGDITLVGEDGLAGTTIHLGLRDEAAFVRAIAGFRDSAPFQGVSVEDLPLPHAKAWAVRIGASDAAFRFPVYLATQGETATLAVSRARLDAATRAPESRYLDSVDHPLVRSAMDGGATLIAHGYETDSLGTLLPYLAVLRDALSGSVQVYEDLADFVALASDLLYDVGAVGRVSASGWSLTLVARFLGADPDASNPRERAFFDVVQARRDGRLSAARERMLALIGGGDAYARKARRVLLQPMPLSDLLVAAVIGGGVALAQASFRTPPEDEESEPRITAVPLEQLDPCRRYLIESCLNGDPEGAACREVQGVFQRTGGTPTADDLEWCRSRLAQ